LITLLLFFIGGGAGRGESPERGDWGVLPEDLFLSFFKERFIWSKVLPSSVKRSHSLLFSSEGREKKKGGRETRY